MSSQAMIALQNETNIAAQCSELMIISVIGMSRYIVRVEEIRTTANTIATSSFPGDRSKPIRT
jgi:hypothetical protein